VTVTGRSRWLFSWPLITAIAVALRLTVERRALLNDPDTYLHIAVGRWIWAHQSLPFHDPFSGSMPGAPWIPHEWLAELLLAATYDAAGWPGLTIVTTACVAATMVILARRLLQDFEPLSGMIVVVTAAAMLLPHVLARPHVLALPLLALWSAELFRARDADRLPPWWLLAVMMVWANLHGGFMAGLALAAGLAGEAVLDASAGERRRTLGRWSLFVVLAIAAALITPNGVAVIVQPIRLSGMAALHAHFIEWSPLDLSQFQVLYLWIAAVLWLSIVGKGPRWTRLVLFAALTAAAFRYRRHLDLVAIVGPLAVAGSMGRRIAAVIRANPGSPVARGVTYLAQPAGRSALLASAILFLGLGAASVAVPIRRDDDAVTPSSALAAARQAGVQGNVFNNEGFGGFLVWSGVPSFIDGRIEMYGGDFLERYLAAESGAEPALDQVLDSYRIGWALLTPESGAATVLGRMPNWRLIHRDKTAVVYARTASGA
jgi:hypothetical protein